ncbi:AI-2E family transporter [Desulfatirhabdium butyrativorans]|uniref:AI-2E family transporter n=1 Tax=Desulfatirhabdium butyrativorans TaxID=340467 RepID=UPI0004221277|nr:AI-2E family transporter [Desulfatirhabdium butyrativorans]
MKPPKHDATTMIQKTDAEKPGGPISEDRSCLQQPTSLSRWFIQNWESLAFWTLLTGTFYLLKSFFLLIFETFLITHITRRIILYAVGRFHIGYKFTTVIVFLMFVTILAAIGTWITPKLIIESNRLITDMASGGEQQIREKVNKFIHTFAVGVLGDQRAQYLIDSKEFTAMVEVVKTETAKGIKSALPQVLQGMLYVVRICWEILITLLLAIIFSFILVMDWERIAATIRMLENSRIRTFYLGTAPHLMAFADILGKAFTAQALIATCNTILTFVGIWFFQVPNIALITIIVFFCGFIPILGTFLSSIPIIIFGIQAGGMPLVMKLIALIIGVHTIEAYGLNPNITGNVLHVHPILVLILLLIGERFFGIWGMVVGVPVGYYIIRMLTRPEPETDRAR